MTLVFCTLFFSKSRVPDFQKAGCPIFKNSGCRLTGRGNKNSVQTGKKIQFVKLDTYFKLENVKTQVQIDRGLPCIDINYVSLNDMKLFIPRIMHISSGLYSDSCGFALNAHRVKNILNATQI